MDKNRDQDIRGTTQGRGFGDEAREARLRRDSGYLKDAKLELAGRRPEGRAKRRFGCRERGHEVTWWEKRDAEGRRLAVPLLRGKKKAACFVSCLFVFSYVDLLLLVCCDR